MSAPVEPQRHTVTSKADAAAADADVTVSASSSVQSAGHIDAVEAPPESPPAARGRRRRKRAGRVSNWLHRQRPLPWLITLRRDRRRHRRSAAVRHVGAHLAGRGAHHRDLQPPPAPAVRRAAPRRLAAAVLPDAALLDGASSARSDVAIRALSGVIEPRHAAAGVVRRPPCRARRGRRSGTSSRTPSTAPVRPCCCCSRPRRT